MRELLEPSVPRAYVAWGTLAAIDLHACDHGSLADPECIRTFVPAVIEAIGMKAHGPLALERFGIGELEGWSAMQFIETSTIVVHADEVAGRCFVDVFSCRPFDPGARCGRCRGPFRRDTNADRAAAMTDATPVLGVLAGAIGVADTVPYVRDILRGGTRPHRGTWLIWGVLAIVVCLSQRADGASWSLIMAGTQAVVTGLIFMLAIRHGEGGVSASERIMIAIAGVGIIGWIAVHEPIVATACVIAADLIGAAMMVPKTYRDPGSETLATFAFASLGGALAAGAVGVLDISLLLYPIYFCLVNGAIALLIYQRRCCRPSPEAPAW